MKKEKKIIQFLKDNACMINGLRSDDEKKELGDVVSKIINEINRKCEPEVSHRFLKRKEISEISKVFLDEDCLVLQITCGEEGIDDAYEIHKQLREYRFNGQCLCGYYRNNRDGLAIIRDVEFTERGKILRKAGVGYEGYIALLKIMDEMYRQVKRQHIVLPEHIRFK